MFELSFGRFYVAESSCYVAKLVVLARSKSKLDIHYRLLDDGLGLALISDFVSKMIEHTKKIR